VKEFVAEKVDDDFWSNFDGNTKVK